MIKFFTVVLIILVLFFLVILKRKYIFKALNRKKLKQLRLVHNKDKITSSLGNNNNIYYQHDINKYSEFHRKNIRKSMLKLFKGNTTDKLKALKIAEELGDKSTLPILRKGLKDVNLLIVERSADLIRKFK